MKHTSLRAFMPGLVLFGLFLSGCSTTYSVNPDLVSKFKSGPAPAEDETDVYVVRGSNFYGGARGMWIAVNDNVVADLSNGSHVLLKLDAGVNSLHAVQATAGFAYAPVDFRGGETLFMAIDYAAGTMTELEPDLGKTMVMQTEQLEPLAEKRPNSALDNLLINPSLLGLPIMTPATDMMQPDSDSAVITFYRPGNLIGQVPFDIWSEAGYAGSLLGGTSFQLRVKPGKHEFFARSERYSILETEVEAGKHYFVQFDVGMGWNQAHVKLLPMDAVENRAQLDATLKPLKRMQVDAAALTRPAIKTRLEQGHAYLSTVRQKVDAGDVATRSLGAGDGIVL